MLKIILTGNTYNARYDIKADRFIWRGDAKAWYKLFNDTDKNTVEALVAKYSRNGIAVKTEYIEGELKEKRYPVKESYIFNLESIHDKVWCLIYDLGDGEIKAPFTVAGKTVNDESDLFDILDEAETLRSKASRPVTGKDYGRIKELVGWRVEQRYLACMNAGMDEREAGKCFEDM